MKNFRKVSGQFRTKEKQSNGKFFSVLLILSFCMLLWNIVGPFGVARLYLLDKEKEEIYSSQIQITQQHKKLLKETEELKKDNRLLEHHVRNRLGWVRDNEILYRFE